MKESIIETLKRDDVIVVFDVDGVLSPYEWGEFQHCMSDEKWNEVVKTGEDIYKRSTPVKTFLDFIQQKGADKCYVCSRSMPGELESKLRFCSDNYGIPEEHINFVNHKADKVLFLNELRDGLGVPEEKIAIVEDTVDTLDEIAKEHKYITVHVSSFL